LRWGLLWGRGLRRLARVVRLVVLGVLLLPLLICWRRDLRVALRGHLVDGGGGWRFSLRRERGGGRSAGFLLGACGGRRLGGVVVLRLEADVARRGAPRLVSRGVGGRVALCGGRVARRVCRGGWRLGSAEALGAGRVRRRCRLRYVWFGPRFLVCAAAT
jgi:hypothetical protein